MQSYKKSSKRGKEKTVNYFFVWKSEKGYLHRYSLLQAGDWITT